MGREAGRGTFGATRRPRSRAGFRVRRSRLGRTAGRATGWWGDRQGVAGVVVEPGQELDVAAIGGAMMGGVGLPGLVRLLSGESDVGRLGFLAGSAVANLARRTNR